jgi:hypothetical protein
MYLCEGGNMKTFEEKIKENKWCKICPDRVLLEKLRFNNDGSLKSVDKTEGSCQINYSNFR